MARGFLTPQKSQQRMHSRVLKKRVQKKLAETTGDLVGNEIADKITWATSSKSNMFPQTDEAPMESSKGYHTAYTPRKTTTNY